MIIAVQMTEDSIILTDNDGTSFSYKAGSPELDLALRIRDFGYGLKDVVRKFERKLLCMQSL